jgi:hypothetical protein
MVGGVVGILVGLLNLGGALAKLAWKTQTYATRLVTKVSAPIQTLFQKEEKGSRLIESNYRGESLYK